ncbi:MAG: hypothetical protein Q8O40_16275, partial [Chloroflexota bacterium]|nr:hypothetical protein [Chloroflexota bacterium]
MATARVTANTAAQALWSQNRHAKGKPTSVSIDNQSAAARTVRLQDVFTPDASNGVASPTEQTIERLQVTVGAGLTGAVPEDELRDVEFLGAVKAIADAISAVCVIIVGYHLATGEA